MLARQTILIVEDSIESMKLIHHSLGTIANIEWVRNLREASTRVQKSQFDLIIIDRNLPDGDGLEVCKWLRNAQIQRDCSVVVLSGLTDVEQKVLAFENGADDYVTKPFSREELRSRIQCRLKKRMASQRASQNLRIHGIEIDRERQSTTVVDELGVREVILTAREFGILCLLVSRPGVVFRREEILRHVWGPNIHTGQRLVDTHISKLKRKLGMAGRNIATVQGFGYRMTFDSLSH